MQECNIKNRIILDDGTHRLRYSSCSDHRNFFGTAKVTGILHCNNTFAMNRNKFDFDTQIFKLSEKWVNGFDSQPETFMEQWARADGFANLQVSDNLLKWLATGERGLSSETIVTMLAGIDLVQGRGSEPYDASDFRRCVLLLEVVPELRPKMDRMKSVSKYWKLLVENWDELEKLLQEEKHSHIAPKLNAQILKLRKDAEDDQS